MMSRGQHWTGYLLSNARTSALRNTAARSRAHLALRGGGTCTYSCIKALLTMVRMVR